MELTYLGNRRSLDEIAVPRVGDYVAWRTLAQIFGGGEIREGTVTGVNVDPEDGYTFDATMDDGRQVWGWLGEIVTINGERLDELTLRERWAENRRRRAAGLPEIDAKGCEIVPQPHVEYHQTPEQAARMYAEIAATYDPNSPEYRHYQGD